MLALFLLGCSTDIGEKDLYVDKLVYLKKDSSLFTGMLKIDGEASSFYMSFRQGIPWGEHAEQEKNSGPYVSKGEFLKVREILSLNTIKLFSEDSVIVNYWQEGGDLVSDPRYVTLLILKDDTFFSSELSQHNNYMMELAECIKIDLKTLEYDFLQVSFVDAFYCWNRSYSKEYRIVKNKLLEAN